VQQTSDISINAPAGKKQERSAPPHTWIASGFALAKNAGLTEELFAFCEEPFMFLGDLSEPLGDLSAF
jgi:hypothetical protein